MLLSLLRLSQRVANTGAFPVRLKSLRERLSGIESYRIGDTLYLSFEAGLDPHQDVRCLIFSWHRGIVFPFAASLQMYRHLLKLPLAVLLILLYHAFVSTIMQTPKTMKGCTP